MIEENTEITYRNVASKYYRFVPDEIGLAIRDFQKLLADKGVTPKGPLFFSILSDPNSEVMTSEIFIPIEEDRIEDRKEHDITFKSYFGVYGLITARIAGEFNEKSQETYWELAQYLEVNELPQTTPFFVELKQTYDGTSYVEMSIGAF
ncbi:DUF5085 family protein [Metabacillus sp. KIGAM252]|uniref:DUF5085 family protein n=1 Tax=Metabacillus flavus TaxID=2823519 RepID=A0ABS5LA62_9BACI|nr:DUF5085 family protein [Metabacillus flavus]MBS2967605.1 DUF5085 family protein [Metabacillus flavus]